mgnify:CR=1 FL=1|jgi:hypothetical protein
MSTMPRTPLVPTPEIVGAAIRRAYIKALKAHIRDEVPMVVSEDGVIRHLSVEEMKAILKEELKDGP